MTGGGLKSPPTRTSVTGQRRAPSSSSSTTPKAKAMVGGSSLRLAIKKSLEDTQNHQPTLPKDVTSMPAATTKLVGATSGRSSAGATGPLNNVVDFTPKKAKGAIALIEKSRSSSQITTPVPQKANGCKPASHTNSSNVSKMMASSSSPMFYVGITLERLETSSSWGLVFTKQNGAKHALILRVVHPQNNGVRVKWCQITTSVPNPAVVYRASTPITPLDKYESEITNKFPPPCDEKGLRDGGLLVPYLNPGDAIISIDGISIASAFPTLEELASFIRQNCQRKMTIVALRHETVWKAALDQIITQPEGSVDSQTISKAAREAWNRVFVSCSGNQKGVKRKAMSSNSTAAAQQPMPIYTNSMFRDESGKPIPYCDNYDFDPDDGERIHNVSLFMFLCFVVCQDMINETNSSPSSY